MDNIKLNEIVEHTSNGDHMYAEKQTCMFEESDTHCGHVFYNEITRLLKFYCTYCRDTYDNIEYFCIHLSEHIKDTYVEINNEEHHNDYNEEHHNGYNEEHHNGYNEKEDNGKGLNDQDENLLGNCQAKCLVLPKAFEFEQQLESSSNHENPYNEFDSVPMNEFDDSEMIIEEIDDANEIDLDEEGEMCQSRQDDDCLFSPEYSSSTEVINCDETFKCTSLSKTVDKSKNCNSFEDCFIKETNIHRIRSEGVCVLKEKKLVNQKPTMQRKKMNIQDILRLKRRRKKVTTVKVIAVKNRIAELYERILNEQQKSQKTSSDIVNMQQEQETQDAIEGLIKDNLNSKNKIDITNTSEESQTPITEVTSKIIGETLITLIPEGTKIPDKLPTPVENVISKGLKNVRVPSTKNLNVQVAQSVNEKKAVCPACGKTFRSHFSLTIHKRIHYLESDSSVKLAHKCSDCDQLFNKLSQLKHHVETVHYPDGFICKICNRQLSSLSLLERHMVKVHLDRPFNCRQCNKNFSDPLTFEEHLASHTSGEVFKCTTCGRKYSTEYFLLEHMRNHKEQVPQTCVVCGKVTLRITQHMKIHTPRPKRLLSCTVCAKVFNFSSGLSHHFKIMHKLPRLQSKPKKESISNFIKCKRRSRNAERTTCKNKEDLNSSTDTSFIIKNETFSDQIIEEPIEFLHEVYDTTLRTKIRHLKSKENHLNQANLQRTSHHQQFQRNSLAKQDQQQEDVNCKEEEAKRVIVELIQNSTYSSFFPDNLSSVLDATPPIAREETISAVNSIVHDC